MKRDGLDPSAHPSADGGWLAIASGRGARLHGLKTFDWPQNQSPPVHAGGLNHVRVLFTIGQTLPTFPAFIGTSDGSPLLRLATLNGIL
jgi:hypothetical protein